MDKAMHTKKYWSAPALTVYGPLTEITRQDKKSGADDGLYLLTIGPIGDAS